MKELIGLAREAGKPICPEARKSPGVRNDLHVISTALSISRMHEHWLQPRPLLQNTLIWATQLCVKNENVTKPIRRLLPLHVTQKY